MSTVNKSARSRESVLVPALARLAAELAGGVQLEHALRALEALGGALALQGLQGLADVGKVSRPPISIIWKGGTGWFRPNLMALSMSSLEAMPSS